MLRSRQRYSQYVKENTVKASGGQAWFQKPAVDSARPFRALRQPVSVTACRGAHFFTSYSFDGEEQG